MLMDAILVGVQAPALLSQENTGEGTEVILAHQLLTRTSMGSFKNWQLHSFLLQQDSSV